MGLRRALDEGAGEIGEQIGSELPATPAEVRDALPDDTEELTRETDVDLSLDAVLDPPLERFL